MANAMLNVPSVTMNGGSLTRVTSRPLSRPNSVVTPMPHEDGQRRGQAEVGRDLGHHDAAQRHDHAARQVDAGGQDDQRLADGDHADDHHLLQDQREVLAAEEAVGRRREEDAGDQQRDEGAELADRRQFALQGVHVGPSWVRRCGGPVPARSTRRAPRPETSGRGRLLLAPAQVHADLGVLAVDAGHRLVGDQRDAGVGVAG